MEANLRLILIVMVYLCHRSTWELLLKVALTNVGSNTSSCHLSMLFCKKVPACSAGPSRAETQCSKAESLLLTWQDAENKEHKDGRPTALLPDSWNQEGEIERAGEQGPEEKIIVRVCLL